MNRQYIEEQYHQITRLLIDQQLTITTMESATSGEIASLITDSEGSSAVLKGAFITYSNEAKILQGVAETIIDTYGVYSRQTAEAMAAACRKAYHADLGIGVTGTFGNTDPANADSVPGEIHFAIAAEDGISSWSCKLSAENSRRDYKYAAAALVAEKLLEMLKRAA